MQGHFRLIVVVTIASFAVYDAKIHSFCAKTWQKQERIGGLAKAVLNGKAKSENTSAIESQTDAEVSKLHTEQNCPAIICIFEIKGLSMQKEYMSMTIQAMQQIIADYFKTQPVLKAWLFGSFARGEETPTSDVDILFVPDRTGKPFTLFTIGGMYMDLKELLGREVDLIEDGSLRPYAAESANRDKKLIYERENKG